MIELIWKVISILALAAAAHATAEADVAYHARDRGHKPKHHAKHEATQTHQDSIQYLVAPSR